MNQKIKFIIFDWSGVISNDLEPTFQTYNLLFRHYGVPEMTLGFFQENFELPYSNFCSKFLAGISLAEIQDLFRELFKTVDATPRAIPGVAPVLKKLYQLKTKMGVLSSHPYVSKETEIFFPGERFFEHIFEDIPNKHNIVEEMLEQAGFSHEETLYVGDMVHDIEAGKQANVKTAAILTGYQSRNILAKANPDFILENMKQVLEIL